MISASAAHSSDSPLPHVDAEGAGDARCPSPSSAPTKKPRRLTQEQRDELIDLFYAGEMTINAIAEKIGCTHGNVIYHARAAGMRRHRPNLTPEQRDAVASMYRDGVSVRTIAKTIGYSVGSVGYIIRILGLGRDCRPPGPSGMHFTREEFELYNTIRAHRFTAAEACEIMERHREAVARRGRAT